MPNHIKVAEGIVPETIMFREALRVNYNTEMCSGSEAGSYLRLIYLVSLNSRLESSEEEHEEEAKEGAQTSGAHTHTHTHTQDRVH